MSFNLTWGGIAVLILYITWKEVIPWIMKFQNVSTQLKTYPKLLGEQTTDFWRLELSEIIQKAIEMQVTPILNKQTEILGEVSKTLDKLAIIEEFEHTKRRLPQ